MIERNYPLVNDWRRGVWVARPTGRADRDYVYDREFLRGTPHKATGTLRYSLADLGGPGWVVARDGRGTRSLIEARELSYVDHGEIPPADVLAVVRAGPPGTPGAWDGETCDTHRRAILEECPDCRRADELAGAVAVGPAADPF